MGLTDWWRRRANDLPITPDELAVQRRALDDRLQAKDAPKFAFVKQDVCEDLYCCRPGAAPKELVESTMLRTGPVALLTECRADFYVLQTVDDPECSIWKERAVDLHWETLEFFESYRHQIPGRAEGQSSYAVDPASVDWSQYDVVISVDVAVPARITSQHPKTKWCYYVREVKAPSYSRSMQQPVAGQDLFFEQSFPLRLPTDRREHVLNFPYHLHSVGWFHEMFGGRLDDPRQGLFIDHHSVVCFQEQDLQRLTDWGPVNSPKVHKSGDDRVGKLPHRRTVDPDLRQQLMSSKYFIMTPGQRAVFGTAMVEAIAAGCLAVGSPKQVPAHGFFFTPATTANNVDELQQVLQRLEHDPALFEAERRRQRLLVDWLCNVRPLTELLRKLRNPK